MTDYFADDDVLNKLGITDNEQLKEVEQQLVSEKTASLLDSDTAVEPNLAYFRHIHKVLFEDIYDFAGKFRNVDIAKPDSKTPFAYARFLGSESERIFDVLRSKQYLTNLEREEFIIEISNLSAELNALHPFRDGNGRSTRLFLILLAYRAGYLLDFSQVSSEELISADKHAFEGHDELLRTVYGKIVITKQG